MAGLFMRAFLCPPRSYFRHAEQRVLAEEANGSDTDAGAPSSVPQEPATGAAGPFLLAGSHSSVGAGLFHDAELEPMPRARMNGLAGKASEN